MSGCVGLSMKAGDLVEARSPLIHSFGYGIVMKIFPTPKGPKKYRIYWSESKKITRCVGLDLWVIYEGR